MQSQVTRDAACVLWLMPKILPFARRRRFWRGDAHRRLREAADLVEPIQQSIKSGTPFLGICLALQLLFEQSEELGTNQGIGAVAGRVVKLPDAPDLKIPHMGWSALSFPRETQLFQRHRTTARWSISSIRIMRSRKTKISSPPLRSMALSSSAAIEKDNLMACQFHPEKSSAVGMKILDNFGRI